MGSMHTGLEDRAADFPRLAAYFAERARGGVGLMVTGGFAPNVEGWLTPFGSRLASRARRPGPPPGHRGGPRRGRQDRPADPPRRPLRLQPALGGAVARQVAHHPLHAAGAHRPPAWSGRSAPSSAAASLAREAGYDGVEVMGSEGYFINQFLATRTNRRTDAWGGSSGDAHAAPGGDRDPAAPGGRQGLHHRLPALHARPRARRAAPGRRWWSWPGRRAGRRHHHQHRHRLARGAGPDHRHQRAAGRLRLGDPQAEGVGRDPALHHQPDQHAGGGRGAPGRRATPTWSRWRGRCWPTRRWCDKAAAGRADEINTCIACNQACLDHVFSQQDLLLPGQPARLPRDRARATCRRRGGSGSRWSAPARPASPAPPRWPSAATR